MTSKNPTAKNSAIKELPTFDDEIDLREIALTLWKARRIIIYTTLCVAVVAFVVSYWILPRKYEATAYVFIGKPVVDFTEGPDFSGLTITPTLPDIKAVVKLAIAPGVLESVLKDPSIVEALGTEEIAISDIASMAVASDLGKDQLSLQVTDADPQRAALIANTWAERVVDTVNTTYGLGAISLGLDAQVAQSRQEYEQAQVIMSDALSKSQVNALSAQLDSKNSDLNNVLNSILRTRRVMDDIDFFEQGLKGRPSGLSLSLGDGLALTTLRQRSLTVASESFTVQIDSSSFAFISISMALESTAQMRTGLQTQSARLQLDQSRLEQEIPELQRDLDLATDHLNQITYKRDRSRGLYNALLQKQQWVSTVLNQSSKVAEVSVGAVPPDQKSSPKAMLNTALAGILGFMLSFFWVLTMDWWQNDRDDRKSWNKHDG